MDVVRFRVLGLHLQGSTKVESYVVFVKDKINPTNEISMTCRSCKPISVTSGINMHEVVVTNKCEI
ncbi:hypothetical protein EJB05_15221 [Eragrostis curvula]|uniref:Uncharacterized protein n=1 Tax=Eragrostis curvula TaxID=38414 RepID=A0A5J9VZQ8_9POAL|nr:hypothetical protein EJB05_15221 [Eragrostis curvula]